MDKQSVRENAATPRLIALGRISLIAGMAGPLALVGAIAFMVAFGTNPRLDPSVSYYLGLTVGSVSGMALFLGPVVGLVLGILSRTTTAGKAGIALSVLTLLLVGTLIGVGLMFGRQ